MIARVTPHVRVGEGVPSVFQPQAACRRDGGGKPVAVLDRQEDVVFTVYHEGGGTDRTQQRISGSGHGDNPMLPQRREVETASFAEVGENDPGPLLHVDRVVPALRDQACEEPFTRFASPPSTRYRSSGRPAIADLISGQVRGPGMELSVGSAEVDIR